MLNFTIKLYHAYRAYDIQISGYNYGNSNWYSPSAVILGASVATALEVNFGYDSNMHLWVAIPAAQYTGLDVVYATNGYSQVTDIENLFTITLVDSLPETLQSTVTAYRPWYRNETVNEAVNASKVNNHTVDADVPSGAKFTDTTYTAATSVTAVGTTAVTGTSTNYARQDHVHNITLATGDNDGQVKIAGTNVSVKGLGSWAYKSSGSASDVGLGNVTNNKQVKGLSSGTTSGHLVTWGSDGYTVSDSGIAKGSVTTKITLSGTDYSASSNTITITKANLQSAVQDDSLVLMTAAERSKLGSIQVSSGGTIDFSGVTASAPLTATVSSDKKVNITHDTSGVTAGTYRSVTVNDYGHVTAGTNPTTLSGYGITDAKIASGVITLGSNTITPLTANSTLNAAKLSGTASISTTGNATTATKFSSNRTIALTGDVTGSASTNGESGWSITTTVGDDSHNHNFTTIKPTQSKVYTGTSYYATAANDAESAWYFFSVKPDAWYKPWKIIFKVRSFCPSYTTVDSITYSTISGREQSISYSNYTERYDPGHYYIPFYTMKKAGFDAGLGHAVGVNIHYGTGYTSSAYYRTFEVDLIEYENCTVTMLDTPVKWANWTGTGTTNYNGISNLDGITRGYTQTGDRNDVNYQNRVYYSSRKTYTATGRYKLVLTKDDEYILPVNSVDNDVTTTKTLTTESFDPFGEIYYYNTTNIAANTNIGNAVLHRQILMDLRYSFNCGGYGSAGTLVSRKPLYLVASPQSDGKAKLYSEPLSQTLPTTDNGLIYIYLGMVYEDTYPYRIELAMHHPIYWYKNGGVQAYSNYALNSNSAVKATNDSDGNAINATYLKKSGDTMTGALVINDELYVDSATIGNLLVNGAGRFANGIIGDLTGNVTGNLTGNVTGNLTGNATSATNATNATNATVAGKISNLTSSDIASATDTWRQVWFSYNDNVTGRPAISTGLTFQTSTNTLKATTFSGNLSGNATSATTATTAGAFTSAASVTLSGDTTGTASSTKGWSITTKTDRLSTVGDNRTVSTKPNDYANKIIFQGLKNNSAIGSPSTKSYSYLIGLRGWSDNSGGNAHELAFNDDGVFWRKGATTSWDAWGKLINSINYTDYTVTKTGTGASGTWGISITGNASTATTATAVQGTLSQSPNDGYRHVWFSWKDTETKRAYTETFTYCPADDKLKVGNIQLSSSAKINHWNVNEDSSTGALVFSYVS
jgi:hypothetical protein